MVKTYLTAPKEGPAGLKARHDPVLLNERLAGLYREGCIIPEDWLLVGTTQLMVPPCVAAVADIVSNPCSLEQNMKCARAVMRALCPGSAAIVEKPPSEPAPAAGQEEPDCARCLGSGILKVKRRVYGEDVTEFDDCPGCLGSGRKVTE